MSNTLIKRGPSKSKGRAKYHLQHQKVSDAKGVSRKPVSNERIPSLLLQGKFKHEL